MHVKPVTLCVIALLLCAKLAAADPVVLSSGSGGFYVGGDLGSFTLSGADTELREDSRFQGLNPMDFAAGEQVSWTIGIRSEPWFPPQTQVVNGTTYEDVYLHGTLSITSEPFIAPNGIEEERRRFSAPMTLTGQLSGFSDVGGQGTPLFSVSVLGNGRVTVGDFIYLTSGGRQAWFLMPGSIGSFEVTPISTAPVPEPTTMVLLGTGLVAAGWRARQSKRTGR